jgi:hypothetical protein
MDQLVQENFRAPPPPCAAMITRILLAGAALLVLAAAGCGGGSKHAGASGGSAPSGGGGPGALAADAKSAATGDIPDNQVFLTFRDPSAGYAIKYPEGWTRQGAARSVTFRDKNNLIRVVVAPGGPVSPAQAQADLAALRRQTPSLRAGAPTTVALPGGSAIKLSYTTQGAQDPVTGKSVTLVVDRYVLARGGRRATIDLGTAKGVDNVDAYKLIARSFKWR